MIKLREWSITFGESSRVIITFSKSEGGWL